MVMASRTRAGKRRTDFEEVQRLISCPQDFIEPAQSKVRDATRSENLLLGSCCLGTSRMRNWRGLWRTPELE